MQWSRKILIGIGALLLVTAVAAWALMNSKPPPVTLRVVGVTTNLIPRNSWHVVGWPEYEVHAQVAITNQGKQTLKYIGRSWVLYQTQGKWDKMPPQRSGRSPLEQVLLPGGGFTFKAQLDGTADRPFKVVYLYRTPNLIWDNLPDWVTRKIPWTATWKTATTEVVDLRASTSM